MESVKIKEDEIVQFLCDKCGKSVKELSIAYETCKIDISVKNEYWFCVCAFIILIMCCQIKLVNKNSMEKLRKVYLSIWDEFCNRMSCEKDKDNIKRQFDKFAIETYKDFKTMNLEITECTPYTEMVNRFIELYHDESLKSEYMKEYLLISGFISEFIANISGLENFEII